MEDVTQKNSKHGEDHSFAIKDVIEIIVDNWLTIALITFIIFSLGSFYIRIATPLYQVNSVVQVASKGGGGMAAFAGMGAMGGMMGGGSGSQAEIEIIRSRMVLGKVVDNLNLDIDIRPHFKTFVGKMSYRFSNPIISLNGGRYDRKDATIKIDIFNIPDEWRDKSFILQKTRKGYLLKVDDKSTTLNGKVGALTYLKTSKEPIELLVSKFDAKVGSKYLIQKRKRLGVINQLKYSLTVKEKVRQSGILSLLNLHSDPVIGSYILNEVTDVYVSENSQRKAEDAARTLYFLDQQLPKLRESLETAEDKLNRYRVKVGSVDLSREASMALSQSLRFEEQGVRLKQKKQELLRLYKKTHPSITALNNQLNQLEMKIAAINQDVKRMPQMQQEVLRLSRDVKVNGELYTVMLNNAQQLRVMQAKEVGNIRIIDYSIPTMSPIRPKKGMLTIMFFLAGVFLGVGFVVVRKLMNPGVEDPREIEDATGLKVLVNIPHSSRQTELYKNVIRKKPGIQILARDDNQETTIESFRSLRTTMYFAMENAENRIVSIFGPRPGTGKTFVSINYAAVLAQSGMKVLLIDGDMRKGHINKYLDLPRKNGLSDILTNDEPYTQYLKNTDIENLDFISTGTIPSNPSELLMSKRLDSFLNEVNQDYDAVVIDAPPMLAVTDALLIGKKASVNLMLLKHGAHPIEEIETAVDRMRQVNVELNGIVFNDMYIRRKTYGYYRYGKYGYMFPYKSSLAEDIHPKK